MAPRAGARRSGAAPDPAAAATPGAGWLLAAVLLFALTLRLLWLDGASFWGDESSSLHFARWPLGDIWGADTMPPLYYSLLHFWRLGGEGEYWLRLSSALVSFCSVGLAYGLGRRLLGRGFGLWLALAMATAPFSLHYAQELRMYALLEFAAFLALFALAGLLPRETRATVPVFARRGGAARADWLLYGLGALLALYTHNTGFLVPATACVLAALAWWRAPLRRPLLRNWVLVNGIVLLLWAIYWPWLFEQARWVSENFWVKTPGFFEFFSDLAALHFDFGRQTALPAYLAAVPVLAAMIGGFLLLLRRRRSLAVAAAIVLLLPPAVELLLGVIRPIFLTRTLIWTGVASAFCLAYALHRLAALVGRRERTALCAGLLVLVLCARIGGVVAFHATPTKPDFRSLAALVATEAAPGEPVMVVPYWESLTLDYHLGRVVGEEGTRPLVPYRSWREPQALGLLLLAMPQRSVWIARVERFSRPADPLGFLRRALPCAKPAARFSLDGLTLERYDVAACAGF